MWGKWFAPPSGGYAANCPHGIHRHGCAEMAAIKERALRNGPPKIPAVAPKSKEV